MNNENGTCLTLLPILSECNSIQFRVLWLEYVRRTLYTVWIMLCIGHRPHCVCVCALGCACRETLISVCFGLRRANRSGLRCGMTIVCVRELNQNIVIRTNEPKKKRKKNSKCRTTHVARHRNEFIQHDLCAKVGRYHRPPWMTWAIHFGWVRRARMKKRRKKNENK